MASRTAWTAGNGVGYTWTACFASGDLTSMANGSGVLSSNADIANQTQQDIFADVSVALTIASTAIAAGANAAIYLFPLVNTNGGTAYGDNSFPTAGTQAAFTSGGVYPAGIVPFRAATVTLMVGMIQGIIIPPGSFRWALVNNTGVALSGTAANNVVNYRTYNQNLNN